MSISDSHLLFVLTGLERELHEAEGHRSRDRVEALLRDDFVEFGRSGKRFSKADILEALPAESQRTALVADRFDLKRVGVSAAVLTYRSADARADGSYEHFALRSSLWERSERGWQISFHQGTPVAPFVQEGASVSTIRRANIEDAASIARIHVLGWQAAYRDIVPQAHLDAMTADKREVYWRQAIAEGKPRVRVATLGQEVVGWISFGRCRDLDRCDGGEVWAIYAHPSHVATGVGRALWLEAKGDLAASGYSDVSLWVLARNSRARQFYERAGFTVDPASAKPVVIGGATLEEVRYVRPLPVALQHVESVVFFVPDIEVAAQWYADVFDAPVEHENPRYAFVRRAGTTIGFHPIDEKCPGGAGGTTVYWEVAALSSALNALVRRGARLFRGPGVTELNAKVAMLLDPFGNTFGLNEASNASLVDPG